MNNIKNKFEHILFEQQLDTFLKDNEAIKTFSREFRIALNELDSALDDDCFINQTIMEGTNTLTNQQLVKIFQSAAQVHQGQPVPSGEETKNNTIKDIMSKGLSATVEAGGKVGKAAGKIMAVLDGAIKKAEGTRPVENFNNAIETWKNKLVEKNPKAGAALDKLKEIGEKHPIATPVIIGGLVALGTFSGAGMISIGLGALTKTAINIAKGEKASSAIANAVKAPLIGGTIGSILGELIGPDAIRELTNSGAEPEDAAIKITDENKDKIKMWGRQQDIYSINGAVSTVPSHIRELSDQLGDQGENFIEKWKLWRENNFADRGGNFSIYKTPSPEDLEAIMKEVGVDENTAKDMSLKYNEKSGIENIGKTK